MWCSAIKKLFGVAVFYKILILCKCQFCHVHMITVDLALRLDSEGDTDIRMTF